MSDNRVTLPGMFAEGYGICPKKAMRARDIGPYAKLVLAYLLSFTGGGTECFPSYKLMAEDLGISAPTISKSIKQLVKAGYVTVSRLYPENPLRHNNKYTITFLNDVKSHSKSGKASRAARFSSNNSINNNKRETTQEEIKRIYCNNYLL